MESRIAAPRLLSAVRDTLTPTLEDRHRIWQRIAHTLTPVTHGILVDVRAWMVAADELRSTIWQRMVPRLQPIRQTSNIAWGYKWAAAALLIVLVMQVSPRIFLAPQISAGSQVTLLPTQGEVFVSVQDLWQPIMGELTLREGMQVKTGDGQATIILADNGVVRMDRDTILLLQDLSDRLEPASELLPTLSLVAGRIWVQGLVPAHLRGLTVALGTGFATVHEGSVSLEQDGADTTVAVFDRRAELTDGQNERALVTGESAVFMPRSLSGVQKMNTNRFRTSWARENLSRDAVHRQEIAQLQQSRLAESAGILPTSRLYSIKRAVEAVDLFLTLGEEAKIQKQIQYADTRLNEAAALIATGQTGAVALPLAEYRSTLVALATGSGDGTLAQFLLRQSVVQSAGELSAALPGDASYVIKRVVLETSSALSGDMIPEKDMQGGLLLDALTVLTQAVESGNVQGLEEMWGDLQPQLAVLQGSGATSLPTTVQREASAVLGMLATALEKQEQAGSADSLDEKVRDQIAAYLPHEVSSSLSESQVQDIVAGVKERIFVYHFTQARLNQFATELKNIQGNPDQGRILRRLYFALPDGPENFPEKVRQAIIELSWKNASETK